MTEQEFQQLSLQDFVIQEAKEKSFEIEIKALKEFEKEKNLIVDREVSLIKEEYERKFKDQEQKKKIEHSTKINKARLQKMEARDKAMLKCFGEAQYHVLQLIASQKDKYKLLLKQLILQGLVKLMENYVFIRCLQKDIPLIESILKECIKEFKELMKKELNIDNYQIEIEIDKEYCLQERKLVDNSKFKVEEYNLVENEIIQKYQEDKLCFGGVILLNKEKNITCKNTLDIRIDLSYQESLPIIREKLFYQNETK
eukprot:TRINITY_DN1934_c0_g1_i1.p1 TRINITY_DN1934_c0_g1~~TRINITY_DN1934_c0_g1_i1.p1  ORF type:complete len:256 (-),score=72.84 TRINITY_DN1934_c0_g1_i1:85-852(-)